MSLTTGGTVNVDCNLLAGAVDMESAPVGTINVAAGAQLTGDYAPIENPPESATPEGTPMSLAATDLLPTGDTSPVSYNWIVTDANGDSQSFSGQTCSLALTDMGNSSVSLVATSGDGAVNVAETAVLSASDVPPTWTSGSISSAVVDLGQTYNLPAVTFHDAGADSSQTATIAWGDGTTTDSEVDEAPTDPNDPAAGLDGTVSDSHAYAAPGTYTATLTLTDDAGQSITQSFNVTVVNSGVALTSFTPSPDHGELQVQYTVSGANSAPFNIGIYASSDGCVARPVTDVVRRWRRRWKRYFRIDRGRHTSSSLPITPIRSRTTISSHWPMPRRTTPSNSPGASSRPATTRSRPRSRIFASSARQPAARGRAIP